MAPSERGGAAGATPDDNDDARNATRNDPLPPGFLDLGGGTLFGVGNAADFRAAAAWLHRNYPEHSQDPPTGPTGPIFNMSIRIVVEVLDHYHGSDAKKLWLLAFAEKANDQTREGWPGRETLARRTGRSQARVSNIATELVEDGVLKRTGGGGRHRGETRYVLLPLAVDGDSQGSASANPDDPVDNSSQGSSRANSKPEVKGSESASQGSSRANYQGSAVSPLPAETSHIPHDPHINQPSSLSPRAGGAVSATAANGRDERDDVVIEGKITTAPHGTPSLAEQIAAAVPGAALEDAEALIGIARRNPKIRHPAAWLRTAIDNGTIADLFADEAAKAASAAELFSAMHAAPSATPAAPETCMPPQPVEPQVPTWKQVECPVCKAAPAGFCTNPATGAFAATHAERHRAASASQAEAASSWS